MSIVVYLVNTVAIASIWVLNLVTIRRIVQRQEAKELNLPIDTERIIAQDPTEKERQQNWELEYD